MSDRGLVVGPDGLLSVTSPGGESLAGVPSTHAPGNNWRSHGAAVEVDPGEGEADLECLAAVIVANGVELVGPLPSGADVGGAA